MKRLLLFAMLSALLGCQDSSSSGECKKPDDPNIHVKESVGGGLGPVSGKGEREYEGPASKAPNWAKPKNK